MIRILLLSFGLVLGLLTAILTFTRSETPAPVMVLLESPSIGHERVLLLSLDGDYQKQVVDLYGAQEYVHFAGESSDHRWLMVSDNHDVHLIRNDGLIQTFIGPKGLNKQYPFWFPDGQRIMFQSYTWSQSFGPEYHLYQMNLDGSEARRFVQFTVDSGYTEAAVSSRNWSPDGQWLILSLAFQDTGGFNLYRVRSDGSGLQQLTDLPGDEYLAAWSLDGASITFHRQWQVDLPYTEIDLYWLDIENSETHALAAVAQKAEMFRGWYPDGERMLISTRDICFLAGQEPCDDSNRIYQISRNGGHPRQLTDIPGSQHFWNWSPDRQWLGLSIDGHLYAAKSDGSAVEPLLPQPGVFAGISSDGEWIILKSSVGAGNEQLYRLHFENQNLERLTDFPKGDTLSFLGWSPDGNWMVVLHYSVNQGVELLRIRQDGSDQQRLLQAPPGNAYSLFGWLTAVEKAWHTQRLVGFSFASLLIGIYLNYRKQNSL